MLKAQWQEASKGGQKGQLLRGYSRLRPEHVPQVEGGEEPHPPREKARRLAEGHLHHLHRAQAAPFPSSGADRATSPVTLKPVATHAVLQL